MKEKEEERLKELKKIEFEFHKDGVKYIELMKLEEDL